MNNNQIITILSDWGTQDFYAPMCKGRIWSMIPDVNIVEISHFVKPFDIAHAAFLFRQCYQNFPDGTIHIIGVAAKSSFKASHLIIKNDNQYFIGSNNGFFSLVFDQLPAEIWEINTQEYEGALLFPSRDIYSPMAAAIAKGVSIDKLAHRIEHYEPKKLSRPHQRDNIIRGNVVYIDHFENIYTNISKTLVEEVYDNNKPLKVVLNGRSYNIDGICDSFDDIAVNALGLLFVFDEHLTIAVNQGNAAGLFGIKKGDDITLQL